MITKQVENFLIYNDVCRFLAEELLPLSFFSSMLNIPVRTLGYRIETYVSKFDYSVFIPIMDTVNKNREHFFEGFPRKNVKIFLSFYKK